MFAGPAPRASSQSNERDSSLTSWHAGASGGRDNRPPTRRRRERSEGGIGTGTGNERDEDLRPAAGNTGGSRGHRGQAGGKDAGGRVRRPRATDPPDVSGPPAPLRQTGLAERPRVAGARAA